MDSSSGVAAYAAVQRALAVQGHASPRERALIEALARRYEAEPEADRAALDSAYARAMREVVHRFPDDPEARTLLAEALMGLSPWNYWYRDGSPRPDTPALLAHLEHALAMNPDHPGANHLYSHAVEAVDPHRAVFSTSRPPPKTSFMPGASGCTSGGGRWLREDG
jgi:hypothetical protein